MDKDETLVDAEVVDSPVVNETVDTESAPSADSGDNHEKESDGIQKRINELTAKRYAAEKETKQEREERARIQRELDELKAQQSAPKPVDAPNDDLMYENPEQFKQQSLAHAQWQMQEQQRADQEAETARRLQEEQQAAQLKQQQEANNRFQKSAEADGIDMAEALKAAEVLGKMPIHEQVVNTILQHDNQAAIIKHLSENIGEIDTLNNSSNVFALTSAVSSLAEKAVTKKVSAAPDPVPNLGQSSGMKAPDEYGGMFKDSVIT